MENNPNVTTEVINSKKESVIVPFLYETSSKKLEKYDLIHDVILEYPGCCIHPKQESKIWVFHEIGIDGKSIDFLVISENGSLWVLEAKLGSNKESERKVFAQAMEYGSLLAKMHFDEFKKALGKSPENKRAYESMTQSSTWKTTEKKLEKNFRSKDFLIAIVGDILPPSLKRIICFVNSQQKPFCYAVEITKTKIADELVFVFQKWLPEILYSPWYTTKLDLEEALEGFKKTNRDVLRDILKSPESNGWQCRTAKSNIIFEKEVEGLILRVYLSAPANETSFDLYLYNGDSTTCQRIQKLISDIFSALQIKLIKWKNKKSRSQIIAKINGPLDQTLVKLRDSI
jgi:hypothetical protein